MGWVISLNHSYCTFRELQFTMLHAFVIFFLLQLILFTEGMFFLVSSQRKCFNVEQPRDTPIVFAYELMDSHSSVTLSLYYGHIAAPDMKIKEIHVEAKGPSHLDFVADNDGYYSLCLEQSGSHGGKSRFKLLINYGYDSEYYEKLSNEQHFDQVNMEVHRLNDQMTMILNEADFQKHKEISFHIETEKMNSAALWWPMVQIGILVATGIFQVQNLKRFFKNNKLI